LIYLTQVSELTFQVIFITAHNKYALTAIKFGALDYLLKPIPEEDLATAIQDTSDFVGAGSIWRLCNEKVCTTFGNKELKKDDIQQLKNVEKETELSIRKLFSKFRIGLLLGVLVETEKVSFTDSLDTDNGKISRMVEFDATQKLRWELRPTIDFKQNSWSLKIRPYFKFPAPWRWYECEVNKDQKESKKFDYRIDLNTTLAINLTNGNTQNKKVGLEFSYNLYFDNAPNRQFLTGLSNPEGDPLLFSAGRLHQVYNMAVKVGVLRRMNFEPLHNFYQEVLLIKELI